MKIEQIQTEKLIPYARNSKLHSEAQVGQIAASIREFGFNNPVLIDKDNGIIAGHGRVLGAQKLGLESVPCLRLSHLTEIQKRAYIIADNRLSETGGGWDTELLALEIEDLRLEGFEIDLTGFDADALEAMFDEEPETAEGLTDEDEVPEVPVEPATKPGDVWVLGNHRLMCGDSTRIEDVERLMAGEKADMVYTDPPYGISIVNAGWVGGGERNNIPFGGVPKDESKDQRSKRLGTVGGSNIAKANKYAPVAGDDSIDVALEAIKVIQTLEPSVQIIWGGNYYANALPNSSCWIIWDKENTGNFADAELAWTNQSTAVRIFKHMWNGMVKASEHGQKRVHPTQKPIALAEWCIDSYGENCQSVLDLFGGSGSSLLACETRGKHGYIMELAEAYCDVIVKRWQDFTGQQAVLESTGEPFPS